MQHPDESRLWEVLLDGAAFTEVERDHLSLCSECQQQFAMFTLLRDELAVARESEVRSVAEARLLEIFAQARNGTAQEKALQSLFGKVVDIVKAVPLWDSRQKASVIGVRNASNPSYRMLFGIEETEIELMVEPQGRFLRLVGEVMVADSQESNGLALIELSMTADAKNAIETESDSNGRFSIEHILPGTYVMTIIPRFSRMVVIEPLELT